MSAQDKEKGEREGGRGRMSREREKERGTWRMIERKSERRR